MVENHDELLEISPADWIVGPYWSCPECAEETFGVASVAGRWYCRSCRSCGHSRRFSLPVLQKKVLYLDQFVVSEIAKALAPGLRVNKNRPTDPFWIEVFRRLERLVKGQVLACPHSDFHWLESRLGNYARWHRTLYEHLSAGTEFMHRSEIEMFQILIAARRWCGLETQHFERGWIPLRGDLDTWTDQIRITIGNREELWEELEPQVAIKDRRRATHDSFLSVFAGWQQHQRSFDELYEREINEAARCIKRELIAERDRRVDAFSGYRAVGQGDELLCFWPDKAKTVRRVLEEVLVPREELFDRTLDFFDSSEFRMVPYERISAAMFAELGDRAGFGQKKEPTPGFVTDVTMLATLMQYCDAVFVDKECGGMLSTPRVSSKISGNARVFSVRDRPAFLDYLDELDASMTKEHLAALEAVYGPDWAEPYETIFEEDQRDSIASG